MMTSPADSAEERIDIAGYDHIGLRVVDGPRSLEFYSRLGFRVDERYSSERVFEIFNDAGVRIHLIVNGTACGLCENILLDHSEKWPGYTHAAFIVDSLETVLSQAKRWNVEITEGPVDWERRLTCFFRDPDGNVLEFNELLPLPGRRPFRQKSSRFGTAKRHQMLTD